MKHRAVIFLLVIFLIISANHVLAESGGQQGHPVKSDQSLLYSLSDSDEVIGSWSFVYFKEYRSLAEKNPPPPKYDILEFGKPDSIRLISNIYDTDTAGRYSVSGDTISLHLDSLNSENPMIHNLRCSLANKGKAMILEADGIEMVYFRSYRMLKNDISGKWVTENKDEKKGMVLKIDGSCTIEPGVVSGYYRLWPSRHGSTITASLRDPGFGYIIFMWKYEIKGKNLILTEIDKNGQLIEPAVAWKKEQ
ncbi:MAG: hypothetical protein HF978_15030 [Desulfobacteraceae bacterium]|nr:hypothetical protein [Desulfobacteraceae bacterium]MBC2756854.1 hypothetical protein [Desulfobacteraceae bacterium]